MNTRKLASSIISGKETYCQGLHLSARWFALSKCLGEGINFVILPDKDSAEYAVSDLYSLLEGDRVFFLPETGGNVERSNYKSTLGVQRTSAVGRILSTEKESVVVVSYPAAIEEKVPKENNLNQSLLTLRPGDRITHSELQSRLVDQNFIKVDFVSAPGQYSIRGSIIDIFSYTDSIPYRISFFGNEIEKISVFDCNTQRSEGTRDRADILSDIVAENHESDGVSIISLLPDNATVWLDSSDMYRNRSFFEELKPFRKVFLEVPLSVTPATVVEFHITPQPVFNKNFELLAADIRDKIENGYKVYIYGESNSQLGRVQSILQELGGLQPELVAGKNIHAGFVDGDEKICHYSDHEIFDRFHRVRLRRSVEKTEQLTLNDLASFNIGDYVVHIDHGVGVFGGLVRMKDDKGRVQEVVKLMYKDGDVLFLSVHSLHKISRFRSKEGEPPRIHKLGSRTWANLKSGAKSKVKDIAKELIQLYARRRAQKGFAFSADTYLQEELESSFIYEDTPDQERATKAVKSDMEASYPMDRLICGDVGFGKTEIAIRAAFKAVCDNKQVAVLVPTTILALQHYNTFKERLASFPCNIDYVSRLRTPKEIEAAKERVASGKTDILIGTHKILGSGFSFKDLGLLVIDEEQKFGVSAKEKLRQLKSSVDTLTLTATPIPRTLQFSLLGARDLSIINTPPLNRIPIQTEIILFDESEIRSIINYELNRGGQVFFLHNKVEQLESVHDILHRLVPDMRICVAHGQMESRELEKRMLEFIRGDYDLLLSTTIIENGLDIPAANTIIINQAQNIGLSDLHQLRGRVGRSNRKAFCYLIVPPLVTLTSDARRRLRAIEEFSDLGSGFNIAMQDLDIRGAGNLLGAEQSGFIQDMGLETYQKILEEAMEEIGIETGVPVRKESERYVRECTVETDQPAYIPDDYIDVTAEKIRIYKELDSLLEERETTRMKEILADRFGPLPVEVENLFQVVLLRNLASKLGFEKQIIKNGMQILNFLADSSSPYYSSETFGTILRQVSVHPEFQLKQTDGRLKIVTRGVDSLGKALANLKKLQEN